MHGKIYGDLKYRGLAYNCVRLGWLHYEGCQQESGVVFSFYGSSNMAVKIWRIKLNKDLLSSDRKILSGDTSKTSLEGLN